MPTVQDELSAQQKLDALLADFDRRTLTETTHPGRNFSAILDISPGLKAEFLAAVEKGQLLRLDPEPDPRFLGTYSHENGVLSLSIGQLNSADPSSAVDDVKENINFVRFTAGHEIRHAASREELLTLTQRFREQTAAIARSPSPHDYTSVVKEYNEGRREIEASAEIAGFNTVAAQVRHDNPRATLKDVYQADGGTSNYIDHGEGEPPSYTIAPGLHLNHDLQMDARKSLESMAKTFYDDNAGYPARNIDWAFGEIYRQEAIAQAANPGRATPEIRIDVEALGAKVTLPLGFKDTSDTSPEPPAPSAERPAASGADDPDHRDHQLLEQIRGSVRDLEQGFGKSWDAQSERMSASALSLAVAHGFGPDDEVKVALNRTTGQNAAGEVLFVYRDGRGASADPAANIGHMPVSEALSLPASERYQQAQAQRETQAVERRLAQEAAQQQAQAVEGPSQDGLRMQR